jgi:NAD(P)-dependent dehydrogenase (short-subunit alcohol dehydrogenase family)
VTRFTPIGISGAVVVVTGGARGIGLETAKQFLASGALVVIGDLVESDAVAAASAIGALRGYQLDAGSRESYEQFVETVERDIGPIDVLVNNAGIMPIGPLLAETEAVAAATLKVNFWALYHSAQVVLPLMIDRRRGHIVNVTSAAARIHAPGLATYVASKHASTGFSRSVREEVLQYGVSVTAVMPSAVQTQLVDGIPINRWERRGIIAPSRVGRAIVGTLRRRPAAITVPRGLGALLVLADFVPERLWLLGRRLTNADRTMYEIDRLRRREYDSRISLQLEGAHKS